MPCPSVAVLSVAVPFSISDSLLLWIQWKRPLDGFVSGDYNVDDISVSAVAFAVNGRDENETNGAKCITDEQ